MLGRVICDIVAFVCRLWRYVLWLKRCVRNLLLIAYRKSYIWEIDWNQNEWPWTLFRSCLRSCKPLHHILSRQPSVPGGITTSQAFVCKCIRTWATTDSRQSSCDRFTRLRLILTKCPITVSPSLVQTCTDWLIVFLSVVHSVFISNHVLTHICHSVVW